MCSAFELICIYLAVLEIRMLIIGDTCLETFQNVSKRLSNLKITKDFKNT